MYPCFCACSPSALSRHFHSFFPTLPESFYTNTNLCETTFDSMIFLSPLHIGSKQYTQPYILLIFCLFDLTTYLGDRAQRVSVPFLVATWVFLVGMCHKFFSSSMVDGPLDYLPALAIMHKAIINNVSWMCRW